MTIINTRGRVPFWVYHLNRRSFGYETWLIVIVMHNIFRKHFARFGGPSPTSRCFLIHTPAAINQKPSIFKMCSEAIKNAKHHILKINRSSYTVTVSKSWKYLGIVSSLHNRAEKKLETFTISCTNTWPNFIDTTLDSKETIESVSSNMQ